MKTLQQNRFTRLFLPKYSRPEVDEIDNLSTAIVVNQKKIGGSARSTLGTITNINALFRVLFSCFATPSLGYANAYSFNDPSGMCSVCQGIGKTIAFLIGLLYFSAIDNADFVFSDPFTAEVLSGTEEQAKNHGYFVLVYNVNSAEDVKTIQRNWRFEGFIVVGVSVKEFLEFGNHHNHCSSCCDSNYSYGCLFTSKKNDSWESIRIDVFIFNFRNFCSFPSNYDSDYRYDE